MNLGKKKRKVRHPDAVPVRKDSPRRIAVPNWPVKVPEKVPAMPQKVGAS